MKYKVIGWTNYEDSTLESTPPTDAAVYAIVDNIRSNGYRFTGFHHQEEHAIPILNDGKKRLFSQRGFGGLMASVYHLDGIFDYAKFAYPRNDNDEYILPQRGYDRTDFEDPSTLCERYTVLLDETSAQTALAEQKLVLDDLPALRYIDCGDDIILKSPTAEYRLRVRSVERQKDLTEEESLEIDIASLSMHKNRERFNLANELYKNAKLKLTVEIEPLDIPNN